jgi:uncharacterized protein YyaL (SSP411 family)
MLYDQALLIMAYAEAYTATGNSEYRRVAEEVIEYVLRDMTDSKGGFYSAEDADSEDIEGKFYLWTIDEVRAALDEDDAELFIDIYGLEAQGNFQAELPAGNIPHLRRPIPDYAAGINTEAGALRKRLDNIRLALYDTREKRVHPYKDDKILADWNGLMIAALAKASVAFAEPRYGKAAERAAAFVLGHMRDSKHRLLHRYRSGEAGIVANVDDYAFMVWALIELYEATFKIEYLRTALELNDLLVQLFWDDANGGLFFTPEDGEALIVRMKEVSDGAIPSGNSVAMLNLIRLGRLTANTSLEERARAIGRAFHKTISASPSAFTQMMTALDFGVGPSYEVVIVGAPDSQDTKAMRRALNDVYVPSKVVLFKPENDNDQVGRLAEFTRTHVALEGKATAYVCRNYACDLPTTDIDQMLNSLGEERR